MKRKRDTYPYLRDPRALYEIRKHKWIESQKLNEEVSFVSAALDWIKKHGEEWKAIHGEEYKDTSFFIERRKYRRFKLNSEAELIIGGKTFSARAVDVSLYGFLCRTNNFIPKHTEGKINIFTSEGRKKIVCTGTAERVLSLDTTGYRLFIKFDDLGQKEVEKNLIREYVAPVPHYLSP